MRPTPRAGGRVFRVRHECFGRAVGVLHEALYDAKQAKCIECVECKGWHSPQQFVKHVHWQHARGESHTVHWGFDSAKWRHYLLPLADAEECCARPLADEADADRVLDLMRDRYEGVAPFAAYEEEKAEIKKEVNGNAVIPPAKEWNMPLKRKLVSGLFSFYPPPPPSLLLLVTLFSHSISITFPERRSLCNRHNKPHEPSTFCLLFWRLISTSCMCAY